MPRLIAIVLLCIGALAALAAFLGERRVERLEAVAAGAAVGAGAGCGNACSAREQLALARIETERVGRGLSAGVTNPPLDAALAERPHWPRALVERAYWLAMHAPGSAASVESLGASYRVAPYLRDAALWRVHEAAGHWRALPPALRAQVVAEARWYAGIDGVSRDAMAAATAGSPVEVALLLPAAAH